MVSFAVVSQNIAEDKLNLVPNASFELQYAYQIGWFYKGDDFNKAMKYWKSPTGASPDVYNEDTKVPPSWAKYGFGEQSPHTGNGMVGLTLFGCLNGKPHCREYIQIQLLEPLIVGQYYYLEFWTTHLEKSMHINNLGVSFVADPFFLKEDIPLKLDPMVITKKVLSDPKGNWLKISAKFKATKVLDYLIIGNFSPDSLTTAQHAFVDKPLNYAYYYIDDVLLKKIPPLLPKPAQKNDIKKKVFDAGKSIVLENIYFSFDEAELLPRSIEELNKLVAILKKYSTMKIEIQGHTDNVGSQDYNLKLSDERALAVEDFLLSRGISSNRLQHKGYGSSKPLVSNDTEEHRKKNRRVEIFILQK